MPQARLVLQAPIIVPKQRRIDEVDNCVLFLWTCWPVLEWSLRTIKAVRTALGRRKKSEPDQFLVGLDKRRLVGVVFGAGREKRN
jgi:hypothetical protein